jgi:hypothetical protein
MSEQRHTEGPERVSKGAWREMAKRLQGERLELLEALEGLMRWERELGGWEAPAWEAARAAILKARGG